MHVYFLLLFVYVSAGYTSKIAILLLIASLSYSIFVLAYFGRDGFVFLSLALVFNFFFSKSLFIQGSEAKLDT